jgi:hypothetical protein
VKLRKALLTGKFDPLSGEYEIVMSPLPSSEFARILNITLVIVPVSAVSSKVNISVATFLVEVVT